MSVIRDFIPGNEDLTMAEKARKVPISRDPLPPSLDFIPDPDVEEQEKPTPEEAVAKAVKAAMAARGYEVERIRKEAAERLAELNADQVVELLKVQVDHVREVYLDVERKGRNRKEVFEGLGEPHTTKRKRAPKAPKE